MATAKTNGNDYTLPPNVTGSGSKNKGGSVTKGGSLTSGILSNVTVTAYNAGVFGSTVIQDTVTVKDYAGKALSGGTFRYTARTPITFKVTTSLAGSSTNVFKTSANTPDLIRSIHKLETLRTRRVTTAIRAGNWNIVTGTFSAAPTVAVDSLGTDNAANPTRSSPGQLTYKGGAPNPVTTNDYKAKTG